MSRKKPGLFRSFFNLFTSSPPPRPPPPPSPPQEQRPAKVTTRPVSEKHPTQPRHTAKSSTPPAPSGLATSSLETISPPPAPPAAKAPIAPLKPQSLPRANARVTIGLDFGTSGTKVVIRVRESTDAIHRRAEQFRAIGFSDKTGAVRLALPTAVAVTANDQLLVGFDALDQAFTSQPVTSFKMCLPCLHPVSVQRDVNPFGNQSHCPRCQPNNEQVPGHFLVGNAYVSAEELSTVYLSRVLYRVKSTVRRALGADVARWSLCAAAPLDQSWAGPDKEPPALKRSFERIFDVAFQMADLPPDTLFSDLLKTAREHLVKALPEPEYRVTHVVAETHAAVTSFLLHPNNAGAKGLFCTVDIGAGTTDIAFFWANTLPPDDLGPFIGFYHGSTWEIGVDSVDRALAEIWRTTPAAARRRRENDPRSLQSTPETVWDELRQRSKRHFQRTFGIAHQIGGDRSWVETTKAQLRRLRFQVLLVGGGARMKPLSDTYHKPPHLGTPMNDFVDAPIPLLPPRLRIHTERGADAEWHNFKDEHHLLVLAHGLAHGQADLPIAGSGEPSRLPPPFEPSWETPGDQYAK